MISNVWREYNVSLSGCPAVKDLEQTHGTKWRKPEHESRYFSRRKEMYKAIENKVENENISNEESARRLEEIRKRLAISIDQLMLKIKKES
ncbi:transcriptional activator of glycolytic enzymes-domain-containing protein, partial [Thamnidium elegans]